MLLPLPSYAELSTHASVDTERMVPFPLSSVRLTESVFKTAAQANERYLDSLTADRLLHSFRLTAGIPSTAKPYGGWEQPDCELRGHFTGGHYLSAVALAYGSSGNTDLRDKGNAVVAGLAACQKTNGNGYLSAFPTELFDRLAQGKPVWAPFYTYHKIMAGLLDMYGLTGNEDALHVAEGMAGWVGQYFTGISDAQRQRMLRNEYGGMNEVLANLFAITHKEQYLHAAHFFEQPGFLDPLAERKDELRGLHANTHVPKIIGAARMYEVTGDRRYREIAEYFLAEVLTARDYVIGNTSEDEHWKSDPDKLAGTLAWTNAECCVAYNLMKLQRLVFGWTGDARWMDEYERALWNCRLGTQNQDGLKQYFFPLAAGYWRAYNSPEDSFWCCTGTGAEEFAKFTDTIYFHRGDELLVNHFIPSELSWKERGLTVRQTTSFPAEPSTQLAIQVAQPHIRAIWIRIPHWTHGAAEVKINGRPLEAMAEPGSYLELRRTWRDGDRIDLTLPMELHLEELPGDASTVAALYGPLVLAGDLGPGPAAGPDKILHGRGTTPQKVQPPIPLPSVKRKPDADGADWVSVESARDLRFSASAQDKSYQLMPMYRIQDQRYTVYWKTESQS